MVERLDPSQIAIAGGDENSVKDYIEADYRIRTGMCPNGCGLMDVDANAGQRCQGCGFWCNTLPDPVPHS